MWNPTLLISQKKKKKFAYFLMEKGIWQKKQVIDHKVKIFHDRFD